MADDFSELMSCAADLSDAPAKANRNIKKAIEVTSRHIKDDSAQQADRSGLSGYAASIDYDIEVSANEIASEIGPNLGKRQGTFGFLEDATGDVRSAPQHAMRDALRANEPDFIRGLEIAIFDAVTGD